MDTRWSDIGLPEDRVIEECGEVLQAIAKIKRFGLQSYHPDRPNSDNQIEVLKEIGDLRKALNAYEQQLLEMD
jgi:NTP pyrophosphatase (non-canonical NTP hydrolase)